MITLLMSIVLTLMPSLTLAYTFQVVDLPFARAFGMSIQGINDEGVIVGGYDDGAGHTHGFIDTETLSKSRGAVVPLLRVGPTGINNHGTIAGGFSSQPTLGFLYDDGTLWAFSGPRRGQTPGSAFPAQTIATAVNDHDVAVGYYLYPPSASHGYAEEHFHGLWYDRPAQSMRTLDAPGMQDTMLVAINNHGHVVGNATNDFHTYHPFLWRDGSFTFFEVPGLPEADVAGVNDQGVIAGSVGHVGFVYDGVTVQVLEAPNAINTDVTGIQSDGTVYGWFYDTGGKHHGFVATPSRRRMPSSSVRAVPELFKQADCVPGSKRRLCVGQSHR